MSHHHSHCSHNHQIVSNIKVAFFINFAFTIIEIIGAFFTNSVAILADAVHDLGDSLALGSAFFFESFSQKKRDKNFSYGYKRFSILAAFINSAILTFGSLFTIYYSISRLITPEEINVKWMFVFSILGVLFNGLGVLKLLKSTDSNTNQKVVMLHLIEDTMGWFAIFIGCFLIYFLDWTFLDAFLSLFISIFILWNAVKNLKQTTLIFLQAIPHKNLENKIREKILQIKSVIDLHDVHCWSLDGKMSILTLHLVVKESESSQKNFSRIKTEARNQLKKLGIEHSTIEIENENEVCELCHC